MPEPHKRTFTEQEFRDRFITSAIKDAGWDPTTQIREEMPITRGRIGVRGRMVARGEPRRADYVLFHEPHLPLAVVETRDRAHPPDCGLELGLVHAEMLDAPFVYSSNGDVFLEHDRTGKGAAAPRTLPLGALPNPGELWARYCAWKGLTPAAARAVAQPYWSDGTDKLPRYYHRKAVNRATLAIAQGQRRVRLVMATGTGKTFTAFQLLWRLWKAGVKRRVLFFLADRDGLLDQTKTNGIEPFGGKMTKIDGPSIDPSFEVYLARYPVDVGGSAPKPPANSGAERALFRQLPPNFFDLVVVDEYRRGAGEGTALQEILERFSAATQVGLTGTPDEAGDAGASWFGEAIYTYSFKQGVEDGFLAPCKVVRINLDEGLAPVQRTELIARRVTEFLRATDRFAKTIVFCEDGDAAERMRAALAAANPDLATNRKYVLRVGGGPEGRAELDNFTNPDERYPAIVTTSKLVSAGVDAPTCEVIVLDQSIDGATEFKQIVGRGARIPENYDKLYFTVLDFRRATERFADDDFDGPPLQVYLPGPGERPVPPDDPEPHESRPPPSAPRGE